MKCSSDKTQVSISGWAMFWVFMIIYFFVDTLLFTQGYDTFYWGHITVEEKQIQRLKVEQLRKETEK